VEPLDTLREVPLPWYGYMQGLAKRENLLLKPAIQNPLTLRLRRIEGQVRGLERMVADSVLCVDLLTQIAAVQSALKSVGDEILHHHVRHCVPKSFSRRLRNSERQRLEEMEKIFVQYCKQPASE